MTDRTAPFRPPLARTLLLAVMLVVSIAGITGSVAASSHQQRATPVAATPVAATACDASAPGVESDAWIRSELYFGTTMADGSEITPEAWQMFLDEEITPRFPAGLTILEGYGQFLNAQGVIAAEDSIVLIIFRPAESNADDSAALEEIRDAYETQFDQESVLRVDSEPVCISF
jgi:hypothetical protein